MIIATLQIYYTTRDKNFLAKYMPQLRQGLEFIKSITQDCLYGLKWDSPWSVDWLEQGTTDITMADIAEPKAINGCTLYNQSMFYGALNAMADAYRVVGEENNATELAEYADRVRKKTYSDYRNGGMWDKDNNCYVSCVDLNREVIGKYGEDYFSPVSQLWAAYWGLSDKPHIEHMVNLFADNFDKYVSKGGYVMATATGIAHWDAWYFGGYLAVILGRYGKEDLAKEIFIRLADSVGPNGQSPEHEPLDGSVSVANNTWEPRSIYNILPIVNSLRCVKQGVFGVGPVLDGLTIWPCIPMEGEFIYHYQNKPLNIKKQGIGKLKEVKIDNHSIDVDRGKVLLSPEQLSKADNVILICE